MISIQGLTEQEVLTRRAHGEGNNVKLKTGRTYFEIIRQNVLTFINIILFTIGAGLVALGRASDAILTVGLIILNVIIGIYQEARAKRQLDKIALLTRPQAVVIRNGQEKTVDPSEIVRGDILVIRAGDQIVVDGIVVGSNKLEVDESLLTGESDLIAKKTGDKVLSGSFCVTGSATIEADKVGAQSFANQLTASARAFRVVKTPLQRDIDFVIRILMLTAVFIGVLLLVGAVWNESPLTRSVQMVAVTAGLVPNGLFFMVIIAYSLGALRIASRGALIQQMNSVESLSNVTVLCMDKTGTLTANRIKYNAVVPFGIDEAKLKQLVADFATSATSSNRTGEAIVEALKGTKHQPVDEVAFSSARKWSALAFNDDTMHGVYVLGALEMLQSRFESMSELEKQVQAWSDTGLRVVLFAYQPDTISLHDTSGEPQLPDHLIPLGLVSFTDELRAEAKETLAGFRQAGVNLKVISGDNPYTVAALARQAGLGDDLKAAAGPDLAQMDDVEFEKAAQTATIFGRITPDQKEKLVDALRKHGAYVAMIGDGINDVLSLKKANLGIAMQSGSSATRSVADIVLLNDSFAALPPAFLEGQRILRGMKDILSLFLTRAVFVALLILATAVIGIGFPFVPAHASLISLLMVAVPTFFLAAWARPEKMPRGLLGSIAHFVVPAATTIFIFGLAIYTYYYITIFTRNLDLETPPEEIAAFAQSAGINYDISDPIDYANEVAGVTARTALTTFSVLSGLMLVVFTEPPIKLLTGGGELSPDKRPTIMVGVLLLIFIAIIILPPTRRFFELVVLRPKDYIAIVGAVILWAVTLRFVWRGRLLERFLGLETRPHPKKR